jgi:SRSO17 transposase
MEWNGPLFQRSAKHLLEFLTPVVATMGRSERRVAASRYVQGLLLPDQRKSVGPMAERLGVSPQGLQQFVSDSPWSDQAVWTVVRQQITPHLEPIEAWVVNETGWPKQGRHSAGVSHQYCGFVGKQANCQVSVELAMSDGRIVAPLGGRLYLPESWTKDRARCARAGVPAETNFATKPMIALQLVREALADGVAPAPVLGDAAYGDNAEFRAGLRMLGAELFLQVDAAKHKAGASQCRPNSSKSAGIRRRTPRRRNPWCRSRPASRSPTGNPPADKPRAASAARPAWRGARCGCNTPCAKGRRRTRETLAGGRLAGRCRRTLSLLSVSFPTAPDQSALPDA